MKLRSSIATILLILSFVILITDCQRTEMKSKNKHPLVFITDFGLKERFVASMKGVALSVDPGLQLHDITHLVEPFNIWRASYTLSGCMAYWPEGTVFVSVVDPGVGTARRSVVAQTNSGHFVVTPDNGTLTLIADKFGIARVRQIDESVNRRPGSEASHTFHGRDVYAYTGARLAAGIISFEQVGPLLSRDIIRLSVRKAEKLDPNTIAGSVIHIEDPFGNIVTNIPKALFDSLGLDPENKPALEVAITNKKDPVFKQSLPFVASFGYVGPGEALIYIDSEQHLGLAVNGGNFAQVYGIHAGPDWEIRVTKAAD